MKLTKKTEIIILVLILVFALFLRLWHLGMPDMWIDETTSSLAASKIIEHGVPRLDSGTLYSRALVFHYLQAFFMIIIQNDFTARLISVLFGLASIVLAYFIAREYSKPAAIIAAVFTAVFFIQIFFSRQARMYQMFQFFFYLSIFLLYKAKQLNSKKLLYISLISLIILVDTQIAGLVLVPFYIIFILKYFRKNYLTLIIPVAVSLYYGLGFISSIWLKTDVVSNYLEGYTNFFSLTITAYIILAVIGIIFAFYKNKELTFYLLIPSIVLFFGLIFVKLFGLRYMYFLFFLIPIFLAIFFSILYKKYNWIILIALAFALIYPSNLFFQYNYNTIIKPVAVNFYDSTAPILDYKSISPQTLALLKDKDNKLMVLFQSGPAWYIKKPDYVFPFSETGFAGRYPTYNNTDYYTGAQFTTTKPSSSFYLIEDVFSQSKLTSEEKSKYDLIKTNCSLVEETKSLKIFKC